MKVCSKNRKLIAWLALDALEAAPAHELRAHMETCQGCRQFFTEISGVTERLTLAGEETASVQTSAAFHQRVVGRLRTAESGSVWEQIGAWLMLSNWRVAMPATAALVLGIVILASWRQGPAVSTSLMVDQVGSGRNPNIDLAPTIANYQMAASESGDKLDELLTRQGYKRLPPVPDSLMN